jgi:hypothetical protein
VVEKSELQGILREMRTIAETWYKEGSLCAFGFCLFC